MLQKTGILIHVVDTDCNRIKKLAISYGADVPFLNKNSTDFTSVNISTYQFVKRINKAIP